MLRTFHSSVEHSHLLTPAVTFGKVMSEFKTWIFLVTPKCSLDAPTSLLARREVESVYTASRRPPRGTFSCITQSGRSSGSLPPALTPSDTRALPSAPHCLRGGLNLPCLPSATRTMQQGLPLESTGNAEKIRSTADSASSKTCHRDSRHACLTTQSRKHLKTPFWGPPPPTLHGLAGRWARESPRWSLRLLSLPSGLPSWVSLLCLPCLTLLAEWCWDGL